MMLPLKSLRSLLLRILFPLFTFRSSRLFMLPQILSRWPGRYVIVISTSKSKLRETLKRLGSIHLPERVTTLVYTVQSSVFPINLLRNLGIRNIQTSHFMVLDMDLMLSRNMYAELKRLPDWLKASEKSAILVPLFFLNRTRILPYCVELEDCLPMWKRHGVVTCSNLPLVPHNKSDLVQCLNAGICTMRTRYSRTHVRICASHNPSYMWCLLGLEFREGPSFHKWNVRSLTFRSRRVHSPFKCRYVILKYTPSTPLFNKLFVNYGYNKIQFVEHLRAADYRFFILNHAFMIDLAHMG